MVEINKRKGIYFYKTGALVFVAPGNVRDNVIKTDYRVVQRFGRAQVVGQGRECRIQRAVARPVPHEVGECREAGDTGLGGGDTALLLATREAQGQRGRRTQPRQDVQEHCLRLWKQRARAQRQAARRLRAQQPNQARQQVVQFVSVKHTA